MAGDALRLRARHPARTRAARDRAIAPIGMGIATVWLSVVVLLPLAAVTAKAGEDGLRGFWDAATAPQALAALRLSLLAALAAAAVNAVAGTLVAWVLVRDEFRGKGVVNALIDLPFALPTIVAGLTLLALYGPGSPVGVNVVATSWAIGLALLFVTLPFVVRSVQPVLLELDREVEEAAASLGATAWQRFRRVVLPSLRPAILSGTGLAFARAIGEFGSVVLIAGNVPFETEVAPVYVFAQIQSDAPVSAAAVSVVLLALAVAVLLVIRRLGRSGPAA
jgi:sulfate/thiosulfate transport system permease protein